MFPTASYLSGRARGNATRLGLHASPTLAGQFVRAPDSSPALEIGKQQLPTTDDSDSHGSTRI